MNPRTQITVFIKLNLAEETTMSKSKLYARRDTVVAILRKMGVNKADYNNFISTPTSGTESGFYVDVVAAEASLKPVKKTQDKPKAKTQDKPKAKAKPVVSDEHEEPAETRSTSGKSISKIIQGMILSGMSNQQIWDVMKQQYGLDDSKKYYPAWNRSEMRRSGKLKEV
jgi:hypothetical protein